MYVAPREPGAIRIALASLIGGCLLWAPALVRPSLTGYGDWQYFHHMWEAGRVAMERFGEPPLWDPFHCGGVTLWGNPQAQVYSPLFLLALLLGTTAATKAFVVLHTAAGLAGMYVFGRREANLPAAAATLASIAWGYSGFFAWHGGGGHAAFMPFYFMPWLLLAWRGAVRTDLRWGAAAAALIALSIVEGAVYPVAFFGLLLAFDAIVMATRHGWRRPLAAAAVIVPLAAAMAAVRLWPIALTMTQYARPELTSDRLLPWHVVKMFLAPRHPWSAPDHPFRWGEYGAYFGFIATALAFAGIRRTWRGGQRHLIIGLLVFAALMIGDWGPWSPYALVQELPVYRSLRVPSRFSVLVLFYLALLAGHGSMVVTRVVAERLAPRLAGWRRYVPALLALGVGIELLAVNLRPITWWNLDPLRTDAPVEEFHLVRSHRYHYEYASYPHRNIGTDVCYDAIEWPVSGALWLGPSKQARITPRAAGEVHASGRTPTSAWAELDMDHPGRVVFNTNAAPGWKPMGGSLAVDRGRLAVDVAAGRQRVEVRYEPDELMPSFTLSSLGLVATGLVVLVRRRRRSAAGAPAEADSE